MEPPTDPASTSLDITLLRTFLEVVDSRGFAPAAERLALTPSAVSGHIKRLEQAAGTVLLARTTRRIALTPAGDTLYAYARNIVDMEREVRARLRGAPAHGPLRVGASEDFAGAWLPHVLRTFRDRHPRTSIELKVGITASLLREQTLGRLDVVFGKQCRQVDTPGELLWEEPLVGVRVGSHARRRRRRCRSRCFRSHASIAKPPSRRSPLHCGRFACCSRAAAWPAACRPRSRASRSPRWRAASCATACANAARRTACRRCRPRVYAFAAKPDGAAAALIDAVRETGRSRQFAALPG